MYKTYERYSTSFNVRLTRGFLFPLIKIVLISFFIYLVISRLFLISFKVESKSMNPTLKVNDRILISPMVFGAKLPWLKNRFPGLKDPERGELVVVIAPSYPDISFPVYAFESIVNFLSLQKGSIIRDLHGNKSSRYLIKRIIGVPGDTIKMSDFKAYIKPSGKNSFFEEHRLIPFHYNTQYDSLPEGWKKEFPFSGNRDSITLKENEYFILGDDRSVSSDSRSWGPIDVNLILGKVIFRYWPFKSGGKL